MSSVWPGVVCSGGPAGKAGQGPWRLPWLLLMGTVSPGRQGAGRVDHTSTPSLNGSVPAWVACTCIWKLLALLVWKVLEGEGGLYGFHMGLLLSRLLPLPLSWTLPVLASRPAPACPLALDRGPPRWAWGALGALTAEL